MRVRSLEQNRSRSQRTFRRHWGIIMKFKGASWGVVIGFFYMTVLFTIPDSDPSVVFIGIFWFVVCLATGYLIDRRTVKKSKLAVCPSCGHQQFPIKILNNIARCSMCLELFHYEYFHDCTYSTRKLSESEYFSHEKWEWGQQYSESQPENETSVLKGNGNKEIHTVSCPYCEQKIKASAPLKSNKARCATCSNSFRIVFDSYGNLRSERITASNQQKKTRESMTTPGCFEILGIDQSASPDEVKKAYRQKIQEYHPDKTASLGEKIRKVAEGESKAITEAYRTLREKGLAS